ncbi:Hypothetical predicted protein [Octopus vulgaris]|uniref:Uncharacterized protein n=1 Tax=Octopus vulgaris TaxID=6645 RepID=A0AA36FGB6_OCTVU|nr:Hypothetical predicted protein [Octopus vulgaris]
MKKHRNEKAENVKENCDEWLSTRNRKKASMRSMPKKISSARKLPGPWKLTQNSPPPRQLSIPTHQTMMTSYLLKGGQTYLDKNLGGIVKPSHVRGGSEIEMELKPDPVAVMEINNSQHFKPDLSVDCKGISFYDHILVPKKESNFTRNDQYKSTKQSLLASPRRSSYERLDLHQNVTPLRERINVLSEGQERSLNQVQDCNATDHSVDHTINKVADHSQNRRVLQQINSENNKYGLKDCHTKNTSTLLPRRPREITKLPDNADLYLSLLPEDHKVTVNAVGTTVTTCGCDDDSEDDGADIVIGEDYNDNIDDSCDVMNGVCVGRGDYTEDSNSLVFSPFIDSKSSMTLFLTSTQDESCSSDVNLTFDFDDAERLTSEPVSSLVLLEDSLSLKNDPMSLDSDSLYLSQSQSEIDSPSLDDFTFH